MDKHDSVSTEDVEHTDMEYNGSPRDLRRTDTPFTITAEQFERLYLSPKGHNTGDLSKMFGNPTPVAIIGFVMALTPVSISFMGWRGSGGNGLATTGATIWFGGVLLLISGILEFILGNSLPSMIFLGYGAHFLTFAFTFIPSINAVGSFDKDGSQALTPQFFDSYAFYNLCIALLSVIFLIASVRTNLVFFLIFLVASVGFFLASGAFWKLGAGETELGESLTVIAGGHFFTACVLGWYLLLAMTLDIMDLPSVPVFDLASRIKGVSERKQAKEKRHRS